MEKARAVEKMTSQARRMRSNALFLIAYRLGNMTGFLLSDDLDFGLCFRVSWF